EECAAAASSSGLVLPPGASVRAAQVTSWPSRAELLLAPSVPLPVANAPVQDVVVLRVAMLIVGPLVVGPARVGRLVTIFNNRRCEKYMGCAQGHPPDRCGPSTLRSVPAPHCCSVGPTLQQAVARCAPGPMKEQEPVSDDVVAPVDTAAPATHEP